MAYLYLNVFKTLRHFEKSKYKLRCTLLRIKRVSGKNLKTITDVLKINV